MNVPTDDVLKFQKKVERPVPETNKYFCFAVWKDGPRCRLLQRPGDLRRFSSISGGPEPPIRQHSLPERPWAAFGAKKQIKRKSTFPFF